MGNPFLVLLLMLLLALLLLVLDIGAALDIVIVGLLLADILKSDAEMLLGLPRGMIVLARLV